MSDIEFAERPTISDDALNDLFALAWPVHERRTFARVLSLSLSVVVAFHAQQLVGFVNVARAGGSHAFILDPTVHPHYQRRGIGSELVRHAVAAATENEWSGSTLTLSRIVPRSIHRSASALRTREYSGFSWVKCRIVCTSLLG